MPPAALLILTLLAAANPVPDAPATIASPAATSPAVAVPVPPTPPSPVKLEFPLAGYRINALEDSPKEAKAKPWIDGWGFTMWPRGFIGSLPSVGVSVVAPTDGMKTLAEVVKHEKDGLNHFKNKILSERSVSATEWQVDYLSAEGIPGPKTHSYERVLLANGKFYHATATDDESLWPKTGAKLTVWANSLEPISGPGVTPLAVSPAKLAFPDTGFRISSPEVAATSDKDLGTLMMSGRLVVSVQTYAKTLQDYQAESKTHLQDAQYKVKVVAESFPADNAWVVESIVDLSPTKDGLHGYQMHNYQKVILAHGKLYQATANLEDVRFDPAYFAKLKACVDSLEIIPPAPPAN